MIEREESLKACKELWIKVFNGEANSRKMALSQMTLDFRLMYGTCPLCEYTGQLSREQGLNLFGPERCKQLCPYYIKYGSDCMEYPFHYNLNPKAFAKRIMELE